MASILADDDEEFTGNREQVKEPAKPAETPDTKVTTDEQKAPPQEDKLGKFKGKTPEEIAAAYAELEQRFGSQGAEIGELRKFTDSLIRSDLERRKQPEAPSKTEPQNTDDDALFFTDPKTAIKKALEESDLIKELRQHRTETQQERARRVTLEKHPEADTLVADQDFQSWVKSSKVRSNLFVAACNFDADAADELFSTYKELRSVKSATPKEDAAKPDTTLVDAQKKAAGAAVGTASSAQGDSAKPIYSRRKIMDLMVRNPAEYEARSDEFLAAYADGRVKP